MGKLSSFDLLVVGTGFAGATIARQAASRLGKRVLMLEKRQHLAGNMFDERDPATGILVQRYGPHSFHTDDQEIFRFLSGIGEWFPFILRARTLILGRPTPSPCNFLTLDQFFARDRAAAIKKHLVDAYDYAEKVTILEMLEHSNPLIREYAEFLFEQDYRPYTCKQWGLEPEELDVGILKRVPVRLNYIDAYFDDRYQAMPAGGFQQFFQNMLAHPAITIELGVDAREHLKADPGSGRLFLDGEPVEIPVAYTGALDEFFGCIYGKLPYRSLHFEYETLDRESFQEAPGVAHPLAEGYTRITEFTKLPPQDGGGKTVIAKEYPLPYGDPRGDIPYYPILTRESRRLYSEYSRLAGRFPRLHPCGRLADFKYYNMDDAIRRALTVFSEIFP
jgi:UDP-galactopyranose mutase